MIPAVLRAGNRPKLILVFLLAAITAYGMWLRFDHAPQRFKVYYVEYEIYNLSRMIAGDNDFSICAGGTLEKCEDKQPPVFATGFPFLGAAAMKMTGSDSPHTLFTLNAVLGVICILAVFLMAMAATGNARAALFASFAASILPLNVILSGNATTENIDLLFLCVALTFLFLLLRNKNILSALGLFAAMVFSILIEPRNVYTAAFILIILLAYRPGGKKGIAAALGGAALLAGLLMLLPPVYRSVFVSPPNDFFNVLKTNILFLMSDIFLPSLILAPLFLAPIFLGRLCGFSRPLFFFPFVLIIVLSLFHISLPQGDFPRHILPATVPLAIFFGVAADWVLGLKKNAPLRNGAVAICLMVLVISSFNVSLVTLRDFMEEQDDFISATLQKAAGECSVFSPNSSIGMTYTKNPSYEIEKLLDDAFLRKHKECKVVLFEMACVSDMKEKCGEVYKKFNPRVLYSKKIFDYYAAIISRIPADGNK
ncbi:MAG: glycosyltransferase family 39 protein [bacterium]